MFRSRADGKNLQFLMERHPDTPSQVICDEDKLRQILINLLGNAFKFTTSGGVAMRVRTDLVKRKPVTGEGAFQLIVEVEDSGPGISEGEIALLFNNFQQASAGAKAGGTGLGLAISRGFARLMGGDITLRSQVGKGSCFRLELALESDKAAPQQEKRAMRKVLGLQPGTGPYRVLAVDDIAENRNLLVSLLQPLGFELKVAVNGAEALDLFETWSPHIVLMDMRMPVMDGYEAISRLKATEKGRAVPIIAVTASAFEDNEKLILATGAQSYLRKPFRVEELFEELGKHLGLEYVYEDDPAEQASGASTSALSSAALAALPREIRLSLRQAVEDGDTAQLAQLLAEVAKTAPDTARGLQDLAERFEYDQLNAWLAKGDIHA